MILGLDVATLTGFAWYDPRASLGTVRTGLLRAQGADTEQKAASFALQLVALLEPRRPDFVAIEQPFHNIKTFRKNRDDLAGKSEELTINPNGLLLEGLVCAAVAIVSAYGIAWECIPSTTWRKCFLGKGRGLARAEWKRAAMERCRALRISVENADAAEAVGIAFAGAASQSYRMLRAREAA